jgi:DNA-directed RNA polymerase subunit RPC12/RpoP
MDKFGVQTDEDKTKTAGEGATCPVCASKLLENTNVPTCPKCGTKPFERPADDD